MTPAGWREAAGHLQAAYEMSERRACRVLGVDRTSVRYQATRPDDGALRDRLRALAQERRRSKGGGESVIAAHTIGRTWSTGQALLSYEFERQNALSTMDRPYTATGDLRPFGGTDHRTYYGVPGNIVRFDNASSSYVVTHAIRPGAGGVAVSAADFAAGQQNYDNTRVKGVARAGPDPQIRTALAAASTVRSMADLPALGQLQREGPAQGIGLASVEADAGCRIIEGRVRVQDVSHRGRQAEPFAP